MPSRWREIRFQILAPVKQRYKMNKNSAPQRLAILQTYKEQVEIAKTLISQNLAKSAVTILSLIDLNSIIPSAKAVEVGTYQQELYELNVSINQLSGDAYFELLQYHQSSVFSNSSVDYSLF